MGKVFNPKKVFKTKKQKIGRLRNALRAIKRLTKAVTSKSDAAWILIAYVEQIQQLAEQALEDTE